MVNYAAWGRAMLWLFVLTSPAVLAVLITLYIPFREREVMDIDLWVIVFSIITILAALVESRCRIRRARREEANNV
ncbi:MAG: hypothetical protein KGZ64_12900 [Thermaerobacter sp.]|nr:hypothetical protein [Thermaerobacter sp.]